MSQDTTASGTIAVLNTGSISDETDSWLGVVREQYAGQLFIIKPRGNQIARSRNLAVQAMRGHWLLFVDSDCMPPFDALDRLLAHDLPIVSGVVLERYWPFFVAATRIDPELPREKYTVAALPRSGLLPVASVGAACLLIRREVFEKTPQPWFRCGQIDPEYLTEDTEFCFRARKEGFEIYLDCDVRVGHKTECVVWPGRNGQKWVQWPGMGAPQEEIPETVHGSSS